MLILEIGLVALAVLVACNGIKKIYNNYLWRKRINKIPGPSGAFPIIGMAWELIRIKREDRMQWLHGIANRYSNGIFRMWIGVDAAVHINTPENAQVILRSTKHISKSLNYSYLLPWLGQGLLTSSGDKWFHDRKLITPAFHFNILEDFAEVMTEKARILNQRIKEQVKLNGDKPFDVFQMTLKCALETICETTMGVNIDAQSQVEDEYCQAVQCISAQISNRTFRPWLKPDWIYNLTEKGRQFKAAIETTHKKSTRILEQKKAERQEKLKTINDDKALDEGIGKSTRRAFLDLLLEASENTVKPLTIEEIREQVNTFMFAGHDTTGGLVGWALFCIGNDEQVQKNIHQELDEVFGESCEVVTTKQVLQLKYLDRVIKEVLRLFPSVPIIGRTLSEDLQMGEYTIPAGCVVTLHIDQLHRDPKQWPNPSHFDPDRFLPENSKDRHAYSYIPFSGGLRNCIGQKFAQLEAKIILIEILRQWRVKSRDSHEMVKPYIALILRPHEGIFMNFYPRSCT